MNYAHLVYGMQMASASRARMYRQPKEDWENFLSGVNGFLNQAETDMRNRGVQAILCPCIDCLKEIRTKGNQFSSFGHTWFHKTLHVLE
jgi:hypothetical protein